jgi:hypothetical protein
MLPLKTTTLQMTTWILDSNQAPAFSCEQLCPCDRHIVIRRRGVVALLLVSHIPACAFFILYPSNALCAIRLQVSLTVFFVMYIPSDGQSPGPRSFFWLIEYLDTYCMYVTATGCELPYGSQLHALTVGP